MVHATGTARIKHAETGKIYVIGGDTIHFDEAGADERDMGPEVTHLAVLDHPELGQLVWTLWEYPVGVENFRETDVGPHKLLENISFGLGDGEEVSHDEDESGERRGRIDALVEWFHGNYEDPAERLPYISREGGYQWIFGGPYDAREVLNDHFPDEVEDIIEAAVEEIEADGLMEWAPVPGPDDYDEDEPEASADEEPNDTKAELSTLIANIPEPHTDPIFRFGDDGLLHMGVPPDRRDTTADSALLAELSDAVGDLRQCLTGTNAYTDILDATKRYEAAVSEERLSISRLYARGVRLANAAHATRHSIARGDIPPLPLETDQHLYSVLELHGAYIMAQEDGRALAQGAEAYQRSPGQVAELRRVVTQFADAVNQAPGLFGSDVREHIASVAKDIGEGPRPERSNQVALATLGSVVSSLLKWPGTIGIAVLGEAVVASYPGAVVVAAGAATINAAWAFLIANAPLLTALVACAASNLSWLTSLPYILNRIRQFGEN